MWPCERSGFSAEGTLIELSDIRTEGILIDTVARQRELKDLVAQQRGF